MSRSTCKLLSASSVAVLLIISVAVQQGRDGASYGLAAGLSQALSLLSLTLTGFFLSYMNRSLFMVSSDRLTVALIYSLFVLSDPHILAFSVYHVAAMLSLLSFFYMLRFLNEESMDRSDYFMSALLLSCTAAMIPQMVWLLIPGLIAAMSKGWKEKFRMALITAGAICIPPLYIFSYLYIFSDSDMVTALMNWLASTVHISLRSEFSSIGVFYSIIMAIVIISMSVSAVSRFDEVRSGQMRKKLRYILAYMLTSCLMLLFFDGIFDGPAIMVPGITFSLLVLHYGELSKFGKAWSHLFCLLMLSCVAAKAYLLI